VQRLGSARGGAERHGQLARIEREHVDRLQHAVDRDRGLVRRDAKGLHRLRGEPRRLLRRQLPERTCGEVEHGDEELHRLLRVEACLRELAEPHRRLGGRELRGDAGVDGRPTELLQLHGGGAGHGGDSGDRLLEATCGVGERERCTHRGGAGREDREADAELLEGALDVLGAEPDAAVEAREVPLEVRDGPGRQVTRGEDEAEAEVVERHRSPPLRGLLEFLRLPGALLTDALDQPVAIRRRQLERIVERHCEA
jgi:hypothetical protein